MDNQTYTTTTDGTLYTKQESTTFGSKAITGRDAAALILGIVSLYIAISGIIPVLGYIFSLILGIIGAALGVRARKDTRPNSMGIATAGLICSAIAIIISAIMIVALVVLAAVAGVAISEAASNLPEIINSLTGMVF